MNDPELVGNEVVIARRLLRSAWATWVDNEPWELTPDIGQFDFDNILLAVERLLPPDIEMRIYNEAYQYFARRAENTE